MNSWTKVFLLLLTLVQVTTGKATEAVRPKVTLEDVQAAVACLAAQDWVQDDLEELHLQTGDTVAVRYATGSIPGTSPPDPNSLNIVIYSRNKLNGWLFFARTEGHSFIAVGNAYRLTRWRTGWSAGEGNGGVATYRAVSRYATRLAKQPTIKLRLSASSQYCRAED